MIQQSNPDTYEIAQHPRGGWTFSTEGVGYSNKGWVKGGEGG